ncbi:hypothetical protein K1X84_13320 [bacterium]|nr:hypothetical protein [bacterium]
MKYYLTFTLLTVISCQSCYKEYYPDSRIQEKKDIVLGLLAPDSSNGFVRENAIEVFVGQLVPADIHNIYYVWGMQDSLLKELMINTRQFYIAYYEYDPDATVTIEGEGQSVQLTYIDRGIYRDVNRELRIVPLGMYTLKVQKKNSRVFTAQTQILQPIQIINEFADTTIVKPYKEAGLFYADTILIGTNKIEKAIYYIMERASNNFSFTVSAYSFQNEQYDAVIFVKDEFDTTRADFVTVNYEYRAIDSAYGLFHQPHGHGMTSEFGDWDITLYDIPIEKRSNIKGKDVVGVFGNYTADRKKVVYKAKWE